MHIASNDHTSRDPNPYNVIIMYTQLPNPKKIHWPNQEHHPRPYAQEYRKETLTKSGYLTLNNPIHNPDANHKIISPQQNLIIPGQSTHL